MARLYMNIDINSYVCPFLNTVLEQENVYPEMLWPFVDVYRSTQVTDVLFDIFCQLSATPSSHIGTLGELCRWGAGNGIEDSFLDFHHCYQQIYDRWQIDPFQVWIDRCRENGQNPWISVRMNDCHPFALLEHEKIDSFLKKAVQNGWTLGDDYGYYGKCYDYSVKEVRDLMLSYICEQLSRYDVYGIELDFMRECQCFRYLTADMKACTEIMNQFMRDVKQIVSDCEKIHGHPIRILVRVMRDYEHTTFYGFDPACWAREKLVDVINPTPRWTGGDSGIPVAEWKALLPGVEVAAGIETAVNYAPDRGMGYATAEIARGLAAGYLAAGSDGVYFFNYFVNSDAPYRTFDQHMLSAHPYIRNMEVLSGCADPESIYKRAVRFAVIPQAGEGFAQYPPMWQPLPAKLGQETQSFAITTGPIPKSKRAMLIVGIEGLDAPDADVRVNGKSCTKWEKINLAYIPGIGMQTGNYVSGETRCYGCVVDADDLGALTQKIGIKTGHENAVLTWLELAVV